MILSDDFSQLDHLLQESGASGHQLRLYLSRHFSDLVRHLTSNLDVDTEEVFLWNMQLPPRSA